MSYRVVQWGTGNVGRHALRAILERPGLELVGVRVFDDAKVGRDAGELVGGPPVGIAAVDSMEAVLALAPDCVVHAAVNSNRDVAADAGPVADICTLLAHGCNVVATTLEHGAHPDTGPPVLRERLDAACAAGGTTFFGSGTSPGFTTDLWPITMARVARRIDRLWVLESLSMAAYTSQPLMQSMGFGLEPGEPANIDASNAPDRLMHSGRATSMRLIADALGVELEAMRFAREVAVADHIVEAVIGPIPPGRVVAQRMTFTGVVGGRDLLVHEFVWRLTDDVRPDWPVGDKWLLRIDGDPTFESEVVTHTDTDSRRTASLHAAMGVVNAIPTVCDAPPGVCTFLDLPAWGGAVVLP